MRSSTIFAFLSATVTAVAAASSPNILDRATSIVGVSASQDVSLGAGGSLSSTNVASIPVVSAATTQSIKSHTSESEHTSSNSDSSASGVTQSGLFPNATTAFGTGLAPTKSQNTTASPTGTTGGAIPQQMQSSMAGLLGFCIMGLIML